jgi:hypothetical protein
MKHLKRLQTPAGSAEFDDQLIKVKEDIAPIAKDEEEKEAEMLASSKAAEIAIENLDREPDTSSDHSGEQQQRSQPPTDAGQRPYGMVSELDRWVSADRIIADSNLDELRQESPEAMILGAWSRLETTVKLIAFNLKLNVPKNRSPFGIALAVIDRLQEFGELEDSTGVVTAITRLRDLRNSVAHAREEPTKLQGYEYGVSAIQISNLLVNAYNRLPADAQFRWPAPATGAEDSPPSS